VRARRRLALRLSRRAFASTTHVASRPAAAAASGRLAPARTLAPKKAPAAEPAPAPAAPAADAPPPDPGPETDPRRLRVRASLAAAFDPERTGSVHVDDVPTLMRSLNVFVSDAAWAATVLPALLAAAGGPGPLLPARAVEDAVVRLLDERAFEPDRPEALYAAFRALDKRNEGFVELPALRDALGRATGGGLPERELDAFLRALAPRAFAAKYEDDPTRNRVYYQDYICGLHVRDSARPPA